MTPQTTERAVFLRLPAELVLTVLSYLEPFQLASTAATCKTLYRHSYDDSIWQRLVNVEFGGNVVSPFPKKSYRDLYIAHQPHWFLPKHRVWFSDNSPSGKLIIARYEPQTGCIAAYTVTATRGDHTLQMWEKNPEVIIHDFDPEVSLDLDRPVLRLDPSSTQRQHQPEHEQSSNVPPSRSRYAKETLMDICTEPGLYAAFMLCRALPDAAISENTSVWPPLRIPATTRARNLSGDDFNSLGHRPTAFSEVSQHNFRLRKWVEFTGRERLAENLHSPPSSMIASLGRFAARFTPYAQGGISFRIPHDITTFATLPESCYTPTPQKPWQGIWCGDYGGHGCEFLLIMQPDEHEQRPLPQGMNWLRRWFTGAGHGRRGRAAFTAGILDDLDLIGALEDSSDEDFEDAFGTDFGDVLYPDMSNATAHPGLGGASMSSQTPASSSSSSAPNVAVTDYPDVPTGRLEAIKITGDLNIPRAEYTFIAPEIGHGGFVRIADEEAFQGARVVRSAGHLAGRGFSRDQYSPSQLIMISHDRLAQFWERMGHISYYQRVDLDALTRYGIVPAKGASGDEVDMMN